MFKKTANNGGRGRKTGITLGIKHNGESKNWALDVNKGRKDEWVIDESIERTTRYFQKPCSVVQVVSV